MDVFRKALPSKMILRQGSPILNYNLKFEFLLAKIVRVNMNNNLPPYQKSKHNHSYADFNFPLIDVSAIRMYQRSSTGQGGASIPAISNNEFIKKSEQ